MATLTCSRQAFTKCPRGALFLSFSFSLFFFFCGMERIMVFQEYDQNHLHYLRQKKQKGVSFSNSACSIVILSSSNFLLSNIQKHGSKFYIFGRSRLLRIKVQDELRCNSVYRQQCTSDGVGNFSLRHFRFKVVGLPKSTASCTIMEFIMEDTSC